MSNKLTRIDMGVEDNFYFEINGANFLLVNQF